MKQLPVKVNWFIPVHHRDYNRMAASVWIRCLQLLPYLEEHGIVSTINDPDAEGDVTCFVRFQEEQAYKIALQQKSRGKKILFDLCVNTLDETDPLVGGIQVTRAHVDTTQKMVELCDVVTCASANIAQRATEFHPWVEYLPDSFDKKHFRYIKSVDDFERPALRAIWSGASQKAQELEPLLPLLRKRNIPLTIITNPPAPMLTYPQWLWKRKYPYCFKKWQYATFPKEIVRGDICISYRAVDNSYNRGHSLFKIGVFMAQGIPALASPLPSYFELLEKGKSGKICVSLHDWEGTLDLIMDDRQLLKTWSEHCKKDMEKYSTRMIACEYAKLFRTLRG